MVARKLILRKLAVRCCTYERMLDAQAPSLLLHRQRVLILTAVDQFMTSEASYGYRPDQARIRTTFVSAGAHRS